MRCSLPSAGFSLWHITGMPTSWNPSLEYGHPTSLKEYTRISTSHQEFTTSVVLVALGQTEYGGVLNLSFQLQPRACTPARRLSPGAKQAISRQSSHKMCRQVWYPPELGNAFSPQYQLGMENDPLFQLLGRPTLSCKASPLSLRVNSALWLYARKVYPGPSSRE